MSADVIRRRVTRGLRAAVMVAALAVGLILPPSLAPSTARRAQAFPVDAAAVPAAGQVVARDGRFWVGTTPIVLEGANVKWPCCTSQEFARMASWGMNLVRIGFQWSRAEPTGPKKNGDGTWTHTYDENYVETFAAGILQARNAGLYVLVDLDGCACTYFPFPDWLYKAKYNSKGQTYGHDQGARAKAETDFWSDDLRQQFTVGILAEIARRLKSVSGVAGYEVMNEPQQGNLDSTAHTTQLILDWQLDAARAIRAADPARIVFFTTRFGFGPGLPEADLSGFKQLGNTAFDLHNYFGGRWGSGLLENPESAGHHQLKQPLYNHVLERNAANPDYPYIGTTEGQVRFFQNALDSLAPWGIPMVVAEYGNRGDPGAMLYFGTVTSALTQLNLSWATATWDGNEGFVNSDGSLKPWGQLVVDAAG